MEKKHSICLLQLLNFTVLTYFSKKRYWRSLNCCVSLLFNNSNPIICGCRFKLWMSSALLLSEWIESIYSFLLFLALLNDSYYIVDPKSDFCLFGFSFSVALPLSYLLLLSGVYFVSVYWYSSLWISGWVWLWFRNQSQASWFHVVSYISS